MNGVEVLRREKAGVNHIVHKTNQCIHSPKFSDISKSESAESAVNESVTKNNHR